MEPNHNLKQSLIASFFLFINFALALPASTPASSEARFVVGRRLLKDSQSAAPYVAVSGTPKPNPELKKICDETDYPSLCLSSITPFFNGKTDTISVLQMSINAAINETKVAISAAQKMISSSNSTQKTASSLKDCLETYTDALDNFHNAEEAIPKKDKGTINTMLSAAISDYETCKDEFGGSNPMASYGEKLGSMTSNCLVITSLIK